ncbi:hypothetical protein MTP04_09580 [Lysinibacillus sp. PLM2]|nr:hypothetical protein MTP04_09580 [Lysinibacillus sp. PLM2]
MVNLLITSVSNKVPLIQCIRECLKITDVRIIGGDFNSNIISTYFLDDFWEMPLLKDLAIQELIDYCLSKDIYYILPTREEDLLYFSENKELLLNNKINVMVSNYESITKTTDKQVFYKELSEKGIPVIFTSKNIGEINCEYFVVKECEGSGSRKIGLKLSKNDAIVFAKKLSDPIFQPFISGEEYSIDLYITKQQMVKGIVVRKRTLVIDGESQITEVTTHPKLEKVISDAALTLGLEGHVMFQALIREDGKIFIIECNARIGGASTLCIYAGLDSFNWWIAECNGENIENRELFIKPLKQVRYKRDLII